MGGKFGGKFIDEERRMPLLHSAEPRIGVAVLLSNVAMVCDV